MCHLIENLLQSDFNDQSSAVWINTLLGFHTTWIPHCLDSTLIRFHTAWIPLCSTAMCLLGAKKPAMFLRAPEMQLPGASCFFDYNQITICSTETTRGGMHQLKPSWIDQDWGSSSKNGCYSGIWCTMFGWCHSLLCRPRLLNVKHSIGETFGKLILRLRGEWWFALWSPSPSIFRAFQVLLIWSQWWNWFGLNSIMIWGTKIA